MQTCLKSNEPAIRYGQVRDSLGAGSKVIEEYNPKSSVDVKHVFQENTFD